MSRVSWLTNSGHVQFIPQYLADCKVGAAAAVLAGRQKMVPDHISQRQSTGEQRPVSRSLAYKHDCCNVAVIAAPSGAECTIPAECTTASLQ